MVGRSEIITPAMEWSLLKEIVRFSKGDEAAKRQAIAAVRELGIGRFLQPAVKRILGAAPHPEFADAAWSLAQGASK